MCSNFLHFSIYLSTCVYCRSWGFIFARSFFFLCSFHYMYFCVVVVFVEVFLFHSRYPTICVCISMCISVFVPFSWVNKLNGAASSVSMHTRGIFNFFFCLHFRIYPEQIRSKRKIMLLPLLLALILDSNLRHFPRLATTLGLALLGYNLG